MELCGESTAGLEQERHGDGAGGGTSKICTTVKEPLVVPLEGRTTAAMGRVANSTVVTMTSRSALRSGSGPGQAARERQAVAGRGGVGHVHAQVHVQCGSLAMAK